jgi:hypothetical protein
VSGGNDGIPRWMVDRSGTVDSHLDESGNARTTFGENRAPAVLAGAQRAFLTD